MDFQYSGLGITPDLVSIEWTLSTINTCFGLNAVVQGFTLEQVLSKNFSNPIQSIAATDSTSASIRTDQLTTADGESLFYRVVLLYDNGTVCLHDQSDTILYQFNGGEFY